MSKNIELRLKQVQQVQVGDREGSLRTLNEIWELNGLKGKPKEIIKEPIVEIKKVIEEKKEFENLDDLNKIKGIGKETIEDIKSIYDNLDELLSKLKSGKRVPLRNDVEIKLRKAFNI